MQPDTEDILSCNVCFEEFSNQRPPKVLPCGHGLCVVCLHSIIERKKPCPECRAKLEPQRRAESYPTNFDLLRMKDMMTVNPAKSNCSICCQKEIKNECPICRIKLCNNCIAYHQDHHQLQNIHSKLTHDVITFNETLSKKESELRDHIKRDVEEIISAVHKVEERLYSQLHKAVTRVGDVSEKAQLFVKSVNSISGVPSQNELTQYIANGTQLCKELDTKCVAAELTYESNKNKAISTINIGCVKIQDVKHDNEAVEVVGGQQGGAVALQQEQTEAAAHDGGVNPEPREEQRAVAPRDDGVNPEPMEEQETIVPHDDGVNSEPTDRQGTFVARDDGVNSEPADRQRSFVARDDGVNAEPTEMEGILTPSNERVNQEAIEDQGAAANLAVDRFNANVYSLTWNIPECNLPILPFQLWDVSFMPGGELLVTGDDGSVRCVRKGSNNKYSEDNIVWQTDETVDPRLKFGVHPPIAAGHSCIWVGDRDKWNVIEISLRGDYENKIRLEGSPQSLTPSSKGVYVLVKNNNSYSIAEIAGHRVVNSYQLPYTPPNGRQEPRYISYRGQLAVCDPTNHRVYIFEVTNDGLTLINTVGEHGGEVRPTCVTWNPMDGSLIVVQQGGTMTAYDNSREVKQRWGGGGCRCTGVSISTDGHMAVCSLRLSSPCINIYPSVQDIPCPIARDYQILF